MIIKYKDNNKHKFTYQDMWTVIFYSAKKEERWSDFVSMVEKTPRREARDLFENDTYTEILHEDHSGMERYTVYTLGFKNKDYARTKATFILVNTLKKGNGDNNER